MLNTRGQLHYWTDSEVLYKGWMKGRHTRPASWSSMGDLWTEIGAALNDRGDSRVEVFWMNSHLSLEESMRKGVPFYAWCGNEAADELARKGAEQHQISPARL
eukprot:8426173-Pyramimonas_sp.AAC.1